MAKKHFYSHLIEYESLTVELNKLNLSDEEHSHLLELAELSLHNAILDVILSELSEEDKRTFLSHLASDDHDRVWKLLNEKVDNIEEKIKNAAHSLKAELHKDIVESNNLGNK